jgi:hypothetical protein
MSEQCNRLYALCSGEPSQIPKQQQWMRKNFEDQYFEDGLCGFKRQATLNSIFTIFKLLHLILILFERLPGAHTSRTGKAPTYPFSLDELDTEFDQGGNGFSALPANITAPGPQSSFSRLQPLLLLLSSRFPTGA